MPKSLVIVESPAKAKTINKFLGKGYLVKASLGHVRDLPKSRLGITIDGGFRPHYVTVKGKEKVLKGLKGAAKECKRIYFATDPDREGEAIGWHLAQELASDPDQVYRVLFHEITEKAVKEAMRNPGRIDLRKVNAQQARRILDRLVGYKISPLLWRKVQKGLSAGRVQSVALRLICEREREIAVFVPEEYWSITATLEGRLPPPFQARLHQIEGKKAEIKNEEQVQTILGELEGATFQVAEVIKKERRRFPVPPFITSTLQQEASRRLRFPVWKTMQVAQQLYEGIDLGPEGRIGLITYMRTDSVRSSAESVDEAREFVKARFGKDYLPPRPVVYKNKRGVQDAHESIRPTSVHREPASLRDFLNSDQLAFYTLIWSRFVASQMVPALYDSTTVDIKAGSYLFRATGSVLRFPGFMTIYEESRDEARKMEEDNGLSGVLPSLEVGEVLRLHRFEPAQHFTEPPPRYTEASLVKELEERGIGRPSTYATILSIIQNRDYVVKDAGRFKPTELGMLVTDLLVESFPQVLDVEFTAGLEKQLDNIEEGKAEWQEALEEFYKPFSERLAKAERELKRVRVTPVLMDETCEKCGKPMVLRRGPYGKFLACSGFPDCTYTRRVGGKFRREREVDLKVVCPADGCSGNLVRKRSRKGRTFYGCSRYPDCSFSLWGRPIPETCPSCGAPYLVEKKGRREPGVKCVRPGCLYQKKGKEMEVGP